MGKPDKNTLVTSRWRNEILECADAWPKAGPVMDNGRRRSKYRALRALLGLAQLARADGSLRGGRDWWTVSQLAKAMGVSHNTGRAILGWLEAQGWLTTQVQSRTADGRMPDIRRLTLTKAYDQPAILELGAGEPEPVTNVDVPNHQNGATQTPTRKHPSTKTTRGVGHTVVPLLTLLPLVGDAAKTPEQIWEEARDRKRAAGSLA